MVVFLHPGFFLQFMPVFLMQDHTPETHSVLLLDIRYPPERFSDTLQRKTNNDQGTFKLDSTTKTIAHTGD